MLCERCFRAEATMHETRVYEGRCVGEAHLCVPCGELHLAEDLGLESWEEAAGILKAEPAQWLTVYTCLSDEAYAARLAEHLESRQVLAVGLETLTSDHERGQGGVVIADIETVADVRRRAPDALIVVVESGLHGSSALDAIRLGGNDYVFTGLADFNELADVVAELARALSS